MTLRFTTSIVLAIVFATAANAQRVTVKVDGKEYRRATFKEMGQISKNAFGKLKATATVGDSRTSRSAGGANATRPYATTNLQQPSSVGPPDLDNHIPRSSEQRSPTDHVTTTSRKRSTSPSISIGNRNASTCIGSTPSRQRRTTPTSSFCKCDTTPGDLSAPAGQRRTSPSLPIGKRHAPTRLGPSASRPRRAPSSISFGEHKPSADIDTTTGR